MMDTCDKGEREVVRKQSNREGEESVTPTPDIMDTFDKGGREVWITGEKRMRWRLCYFGVKDEEITYHTGDYRTVFYYDLLLGWSHICWLDRKVWEHRVTTVNKTLNEDNHCYNE